MIVKDVMTKVALVLPNATLTSAAQLMDAQDTSLLAVVDAKGNLVGTLCDRDIVSRAVSKGLDCAVVTVKAAMAESQSSVVDSASIADAAKLMSESGLTQMLVVDSSGSPVGAIAAGAVRDGSVGRLDNLASARARSASPMSQRSLATISRRLGFTKGGNSN